MSDTKEFILLQKHVADNICNLNYKMKYYYLSLF